MQTQMREIVSNPTDTMHRSESNHLHYCIALAHKTLFMVTLLVTLAFVASLYDLAIHFLVA